MAIITKPLPPMDDAIPSKAVKVYTLTGDRSDCCPSRAYAVATINDVELRFCGHHWRQHRAKITEATCDWVDETEAILLMRGIVSDV